MKNPSRALTMVFNPSFAGSGAFGRVEGRIVGEQAQQVGEVHERVVERPEGEHDDGYHRDDHDEAGGPQGALEDAFAEVPWRLHGGTIQPIPRAAGKEGFSENRG